MIDSSPATASGIARGMLPTHTTVAATALVLLCFLPAAQPVWSRAPDGAEMAFDLVHAEALGAAHITSLLLGLQVLVLSTISLTSVIVALRFSAATAAAEGRKAEGLWPLVAGLISPAVEPVPATVARTVPPPAVVVEKPADKPAAEKPTEVSQVSLPEQPVSLVPQTLLALDSGFVELPSAAAMVDDDLCSVLSATTDRDVSELALLDAPWHVLDGVFDGVSAPQCARIAAVRSFQDFHCEWRRLTELAQLQGGRFRRFCREEWSSESSAAVAVVRLPNDTSVAASVWAEVVMALVSRSSSLADEPLLNALSAADICARDECIELSLWIDVPTAACDADAVYTTLQLDRGWPVEVHLLDAASS